MPTKKHDKAKHTSKPVLNTTRKPSERAVERQLKRKFEEIFHDLVHVVEKLPRRGFMEVSGSVISNMQFYTMVESAHETKLHVKKHITPVRTMSFSPIVVVFVEWGVISAR